MLGAKAIAGSGYLPPGSVFVACELLATLYAARIASGFPEGIIWSSTLKENS